MAVAGTLSVNIIARTREFVRGITKARKGLSGFVGKVGMAARKLNLWSAAITGFSAKLSFDFVKRMADASTNILDVSEKLSISTQDLELFRFAAEATGSSAQTLDMGLQRMSRRIAEAARGTGEAAKTFRQLNLEAAELVELNPREQFEAIAKEIRKLDRGEQFDPFGKIFDSEAMALINVAREGLEGYVEAFESAGGPTSRRALENSRKLSLNMQIMTARLSHMARVIVSELTPAINGLVTELNQIIAGMRFLREQPAVGAGRGVIRSGTDILSAPFGRAGQIRMPSIGQGAMGLADPSAMGFGGFMAGARAVQAAQESAVVEAIDRQTQEMKQTQMSVKPF